MIPQKLFYDGCNGKEWNNWLLVTPSDICSVIQIDSDGDEEFHTLAGMR